MDPIHMKSLFAIVLMLCTSLGWCASPAPIQAPVIQGEILEIKDVEVYTYLRLKTSSGEVWAAVTKESVKKGATVTIENAQRMDNFESKSLKKTFPVIYFGSIAHAKPVGAAAVAEPVNPHASGSKAPVIGDVKVTKATGADARTVAELVGKVAELKDKTVVLHAKVVKFSAGIMGKNWAHLRDGTGSASDGTNDILATTQDQVAVGDIVTVKGVLRRDKDFGSGYSYAALIEDAKLQK
jgi:hypothetical protein